MKKAKREEKKKERNFKKVKSPGIDRCITEENQP